MSATKPKQSSKQPELETYLFPTLGVSVEAVNPEDALGKVNELTKTSEVGDGNS